MSSLDDRIYAYICKNDLLYNTVCLLAKLGYLLGGVVSFGVIITGLCKGLIASTEHIYAAVPKSFEVIAIGVGGLLVTVVCQMIYEDLKYRRIA